MSDNARGAERFCAACGQPARPGAYCVYCGARLEPEGAPAPPPTAPPAAPAPPVAPPYGPPAVVATPGTAPPRKRRHGCLIGCLVAVLLPLVLCGGIAAYVALRPSPADELLSGPPDEAAAAALTAEMASRGIPTDSAEVHVFPMSDGSGSIAYAKVDLARASADSGKPMPEYFSALGASDAARAAGVARVALEIVDDSGQMLALTTTDAASCAAYADGSLGYDEFLATMDGRIGPGMVTMWLGE